MGMRTADEAPGPILLPLAVGATALASVLVALPWVARAPFGILAADAGLAWGVLGLLRLAQAEGQPLGGAQVVALAPWLGVPVVAARLAHRLGSDVPAWATWTLAPHALLVAAALAALALLHRARPSASRAHAIAVGLAGAGLVAALLAAFVLARPPSAGPALLFAATVGLVAAALAVQRLLAPLHPATAALGSASALAVAAAQLLDGIVTYLSVVDPLGVLASPLREQVVLSALLLETTGVGYPLVKWALAVALVLVAHRGQAARSPPAARAGYELLVILLGLGPGLFSATQLLSA